MLCTETFNNSDDGVVFLKVSEPVISAFMLNVMNESLGTKIKKKKLNWTYI